MESEQHRSQQAAAAVAVYLAVTVFFFVYPLFYKRAIRRVVKG